ncbi:MAG: hypothetical protein SEPTF4163_002364 [Sporothrix epigloea]
MSVDLEADVEDPPEEWQNMELDENAEAAATDLPVALNESSARHIASQAGNGGSRNGNILASPTADADIGDTTMQVDAAMDDTDDAEPPVPPILAQQQHAGHQPLESRQQQQGDDNLEQGAEIHVSHATSNPMPIPSGSRYSSRSGSAIPTANGTSGDTSGSESSQTSSSPSEHNSVPPGPEGPITPRNDAGPWVFDGSGIRVGSSRASIGSRHGEMRSLDTAAAEISRHFEQ